jgi:hypothetical protein
VDLLHGTSSLAPVSSLIYHNYFFINYCSGYKKKYIKISFFRCGTKLNYLVPSPDKLVRKILKGFTYSVTLKVSENYESEFLIKIIILYSEGGLVCRGMIENFSDLNVLTFVSLSSPQGGQYGGIFHRILGFYLVIVICLFLNRFFSATDF